MQDKEISSVRFFRRFLGLLSPIVKEVALGTQSSATA